MVNSFHGSRPIFRPPTPWNSTKPHCQICHKQGHTTDTCWHKYDPPVNSSYNVNLSQSSFSADNDCAPSILGAPSTIGDPLWYPDSGATNHITKDSSVFHTKSPYQGSETLKVSNSQGMHIIHTGSTFYIAPNTNTKFLLRNLLHVPRITKNLISVAQFTKDNYYYFKFYPHSCFVKHQDTHQILLQGFLKDGLYVFPSSTVSFFHTANHASYKPHVPTLQLWHNRLGHITIGFH